MGEKGGEPYCNVTLCLCLDYLQKSRSFRIGSKSVIAPLSRKVFTASLVEVDTLRIVFAAFLTDSADSSAFLVKFLSCKTFFFFEDNLVYILTYEE